MLTKIFSTLLIIAFTNCIAYSQNTHNTILKENQIDLSGKWYFRVDSLNKGITEKWFTTQLKEEVSLPGSMTTNGKGNEVDVNTPWTGSIFDSSYFTKSEYSKYRRPGNIKVPFWLQPVKSYKGAAWYQKKIHISQRWTNKHLELFLERCHWQTMVWVDNDYVGMENSLGTPHVFDMSQFLQPGDHTLTIRVDNSNKDIIVGENSHSISDHTQTNWNGIIGRICLQESDRTHIENIKLYPDIKTRLVTARFQIIMSPVAKQNCHISLQVFTNKKTTYQPQTIAKSVFLEADTTLVEMVCPMGNAPALWSEFEPTLYRMQVSVTTNDGKDSKQVTFGMRDFSTRGTQFAINGNPTFLRGTLDCAAFPKTGYPPTDTGSWLRIFKTIKQYGLNHIRFHSWCPPEAAFAAADSLGLYLQIEASSWANQGATIGDGQPVDEWLYKESNRIVDAYGNHPSFCMLTYGNEPAGKNHTTYLTNFVTYWKAKDARRLYTTAAGWPVIAENDYNSTSDPRIQHWNEGVGSIINSKPPSTSYDWAKIIAPYPIPTVSHEIGQWCVYPDFTEVKQYDGILKAKNFEIFRDRLHENGLDSFSSTFLYASGKLQTLCYKADIEAALRTKGFAGFQLLGLNDFPGQGTALVGVLNAFWKEKGYVNSKEYSQFCNIVVPLARMEKLVYRNNESLNANVEIAQFGPGVLKSVTPRWEVSASDGIILFKGTFAKTDIATGNGIQLGTIQQSLDRITTPSMLTLTVSINNYRNSWTFFVYPNALPEIDNDILVTQSLDKKAQDLLEAGGKVLLSIKKGDLLPAKGGDIAIGFSSIFWNTAWTNGQPPFSLGIVCNPNHPALADFPTQAYSNYQWWDAMSHSNAIKLDEVTKGLQPIVRVIDDWVTARSLGLIFECNVGKGKLLVSGIDLISDAEKRPEAKQLMYSLRRYMAGTKFNPGQVVDISKIIQLYSNN